MKMKKLILIFVTIIMLFLLCTSCNMQSSYENDSQEYAYLEIFKRIKNSFTEEALQLRNYIAIDLTNVMYEHTEHIQTLIESYLVESHFTLLWDDMDGLLDKGYIDTDNGGLPASFENGFLFAFNDIELTNKVLISNLSVWYGNLGAKGGRYTAEIERGEWLVKQVENQWSS